MKKAITRNDKNFKYNLLRLETMEQSSVKT